MTTKTIITNNNNKEKEYTIKCYHCDRELFPLKLSFKPELIFFCNADCLEGHESECYYAK